MKPKTIVSVHDSLSSPKDAALADATEPIMALTSPRADVSPGGATIATLVEQVQAEYAEMPGLSVTLPQAQRLWAVDQTTCEEVFRRLVAKGLLRLTAKGRFVRA